jgi:hypothetical protein
LKKSTQERPFSGIKTTALLLLLAHAAHAQRLEHHDVLLFGLRQNADSSWQLGAPRFLTQFNPRGYNNQPNFLSNNELYLTCQTPDDTTQTEIYALDLAAQTRAQVTATARTAEYSPTPMPGGKRFSAVRVEEDGAQRLWSFPLDRSDNGRPELPRITGVGYHCWLRDTLLALFIVGREGQPHTLQVAGLRGQKTQRVASNIGRCLLKTGQQRLAFVQKATEQTWFLKTWDPASNLQEIVVKMPTGSEDFALLPDGSYLCGSAAKLFQYKPGRQADWREIANLGQYGIRKITRLSASKDGKLAVVVE